MKYFGTDGIRGSVEQLLTPSFITKVGLATGEVFNKEGIKKVCVGKDPRISSHFIMDVLIGVLNAKGIDVVDLGVVSTPVVSYTIINNSDIQVGIMISASHNPYMDNGIKYFGTDGKKLSERLELEIEDLIDLSEDKLNIDNIGKRIYQEAYKNAYVDYLVGQCTSLEGVNIALDCSNGSASSIAPITFNRLGANVSVLANTPDGYNINKEVGSTHTAKFQDFVKKGNYDYGFSYDGDADRIMLIDNTGSLLDGDFIIYLLAKYFKNKGMLNDKAIVSTVMTNIGFKKAIEKLEINNFETSVGDKYVMRELDAKSASLGGEQSGHIIIPNLLPTGDGILTSVVIANILRENPDYLEEVKKEMVQYPQKLVNYKCKNKKVIMEDEKLSNYIVDLEKKIGSEGRILVRASGTEELVRVMVEHQKIEECDKIIDSIIEKIKKI